ncbi:helix-turn-helix domain-containing protein [Leifsonia sp. 21MFCrub1.1]|uniref:helix-turn-helix domain-containing protein n=1 Tax=Leifsonia sp. 21MFCrub1.1 TaxID=1798223 RepID=UPI000B7C91C4|nr:helix-turn-helix domain-containing protein [Leifsonia sp. 21MFCrub1.1]
MSDVDVSRRPQMEVDQVWAWHSKKHGSLVPARITDTSGRIRVRAQRTDLPDSAPPIDDLRVNFWCLWDQRDAYLEMRHWLGARLTALQRGEPVGPPNRPWERRKRDGGVSDAYVIREAPSAMSAPRRVAYTLSAAAEECGVSPSFLREFVNHNDLVVHYANSKVIILAEDLHSWIESLPTERA